MPFHTEDGTTVLFPICSGRTLIDASPLTFFSRVFATNQTLRPRNVTESDIDSLFKGTLSSASVNSFAVKAERKGIVERWESSSDWAAIRQILCRADVNNTGRKPKLSMPLEIEYSGTKTPLLVQRMSERTREKLVCMGKTLRVYLPSRVNRAALTNTTHIHLIGHNETGGLKLCEVEIVPAFHPSIAIEFDSRSLLNRLIKDLPTSAFSFDYKRVVHVAAGMFDAKARDTIYTLGSGPLPESCAIHESLRRFFINKGYVANSDVVSKEENGVKKTYVMARCKEGPAFMRKLGAVSRRRQDQLDPATFAETCEICRPCKKRAQLERQAPFAIEAQSRQELDFRPTGPPRVKLPGLTEAFPDMIRQSYTVPQSKLKASLDVYRNDTPGLQPLDDGHEDARKKLKVRKEVLTSKLKSNSLPAKLPRSEHLDDSRNDRVKKPDVVKDGLSMKHKREHSSDNLAGPEPSSPGSKDGNKRSKLGEKEDLVSEDCAQKARDFLTELEESLNF